MVTNSDTPASTAAPDTAHVADLLIGLLALATDYHDPSRICTGVSTGAAQLPGVGAAGVLVRSPTGSLVPVGASGEDPDLLELLVAGASSHPAVTCVGSGRPVAVEGLGAQPRDVGDALFATALPLGIGAAYALPLNTGESTVGVLHLFGGAPVPPGSLSVGRSLADVATLALLGADPDLDAAMVTQRLHLAIEARVTVEQAKGVLAVRFAITPEAGFGRLAAAATATRRSLGNVAAAVVHRRTDAVLDAALATPPPTDH